VQYRVRFGRLWVDVLNFHEAITAVRDLVRRGEGGAIFTPNVDHVVLVDQHPKFRQAYRRASLSLADGMPLVWTSRLLGKKIPEKLSGSDMIEPLIQVAAAEQWRVYFLGGMPGDPGAARVAADRLRAAYGVNIVGIDPAKVSADGDTEADREVAARVRAAKPDIVFVALGTPKQELWISQWLNELRPTVAIGCGASLDFISGQVTRAPRWVSEAGFEWAFRLAQDPKRMWRRYLVRGPRFFGILLRTARLRDKQRIKAIVRGTTAKLPH
jgi:N-acetylglucosaminyldiphosphoundecaprenol N-acetyl-beta-D-mannosaminyltransferase